MCFENKMKLFVDLNCKCYLTKQCAAVTLLLSNEMCKILK